MKGRIPIEYVLSMIKQGYTDADVIQYLREDGYSPRQINDAINQAKIKLELEKTAGMRGMGGVRDMSGMKSGGIGDSEEVYDEQEMAPSIMNQEGEGEGEVGSEERVEEVGYEEGPSEESGGSEESGETEANEENMANEERAPVMPSIQAPEAGSEAYPYSYPSALGTAQPVSTESMEELAEEIIAEKWREFIKKTGDIPEFKIFIETRLKSVDDRLKRLEKNFDKLQSATLGKVQTYGKDVKSLGTEIQALQGAFSKVLKPLTSSIKEIKELNEDMRKVKARVKNIKTLKKKIKPQNIKQQKIKKAKVKKTGAKKIRK